MPNLRLEDENMVVSVTYTTPFGEDPVVSSPDVISLVGMCRSLHSVDPMIKIRFVETVIAGVYDYNFDNIDGRKWKQTIDFRTTPKDPGMTFNVPDMFRLSEFSAQRPLRDHLVFIRNKYGVTGVKVDWK